MKINTKLSGIVLLTFFCFSLSACYPLATGSFKWRIIWKPKSKTQKKELLQSISKIQSSQKPVNIVLIVADDLGKAEVSAYGSKRLTTTHIDVIANEGVLFQDAYVSSPVCAPSRAGILTGRNQCRFGFETQIYEQYPSNFIEYLTGRFLADTEDWIMRKKPVFPREWQVAKQGLPPSEISIAELLKTQGYTNGIIGKWHLGHHRRLKPKARGFDYQYGFYGASSLYTPTQKSVGVPFYIQDKFSSRFQWKNARDGNSAIMLNDKKIKEEDYLTFAIRDEAVDFIDRNKDAPFFLYVPFSAPHVPFQAPQEYYDKFAHIGDKNKRIYYAMIAAMDDAIGTIHKKIRDEGLEENTLIIFMSDNGGAEYTGATDNYPLKGGKLTQFEGGLQVPFMMKWKGVIPEKEVFKESISSLDLFTTIAAATGIKLPKDRVYDGVDLLPYVLNEETRKPIPHDVLYWRAEHIWAIKKGDYKLILSNRDGWLELYNLKEDKGEKKDISRQYPELVNMLLKEHRQWQTELPEKALWPNYMDYKYEIDSMVYMFPP